jgi:hypothetical protein
MEVVPHVVPAFGPPQVADPEAGVGRKVLAPASADDTMLLTVTKNETDGASRLVDCRMAALAPGPTGTTLGRAGAFDCARVREAGGAFEVDLA